jgi:hypothetical protein
MRLRARHSTCDRTYSTGELAIGQRFGVDINDPRQLKGLGRLVNTHTARGQMKSHPVIDFLLWTPRMILAHVDVLTMHVRDVGKPRDERITAYARFRSAVNLLEFLGSTAGVIMLARAFAGGDDDDKDAVATLDPTNADLGSVKIGNTRFNITGGVSAIVVLVARLISGKYTSSTSGEVRDLYEPKYGARSAYDTLIDFMGNKFAPLPSEVLQHLKGEDRSLPRIAGKPQKPTVLRSIARQFIPLPVTNMREVLNDPDSAPFIAAYIADALGISVNTYPGYGPKVHALNGKLYDSQQAGDARAEKRFTRVWNVIKRQVKKASDDPLSKEASAARKAAEKIANAAIHGKTLLDGLDITNHATARIVATDVYHEIAESVMAGDKLDSASLLNRLKTSIRAQGILPDTVTTDARKTVRGAYTTQFNEALEAGDAKLAKQVVQAREALKVPLDDQFDNHYESVRTRQTKGELTTAEAAKLKAAGKAAIYGR